jgi:N-dimethylarginine dimethylaminohydrolase
VVNVLQASNTHQKAMESAAEPPFVDELEAVWGERWGASDEVGRLRRAIVRSPGEELAVITADAWDEDAQALVDPDGQWYWTDREAPRLDDVRDQHRGLIEALQREGVEVAVAEPMASGDTKAIYVRDPFVMTPRGAIVGRMGVRMRRGEEPEVTKLLANLGVPIVGTITESGTLEGGSYLKLRPDLHVLGTSIRCNQAGADQLRSLLALMGVELLVVSIPGWSIHLDLHMGLVDVDTVLVDAERLPYDFLIALQRHGFKLIEADLSEPWGINLLCLRPGRVLMADESPRNAERLDAAGIEVVTVPYGELHKNGGGIHCSTNELVRDSAR